jgi:septation ring formation regulator EzrA
MLFILAIPVMADSNPSDVPPSHWAYKAVKQLIDKGYLQLYQDQTFQGDKPVDRYTVAVIVAKILNEIANGQVGANKDDMALIKSLTNEFREEFVGVNSKNNIYMKKLDNLQKEQTVIKEDITKLTDEQLQFQKEAQQMISDIQSLRDENIKLKADVERIQAELNTTKRYMWLAIILGVLGVAM